MMALRPLRSPAYITVSPSLVHCSRDIQPKNSSFLIDWPPSNGRIKSSRFDSFLPMHAIVLPSGDTEGMPATKSVSCVASPPSIGTLHKCQSSVELKSTHLPSTESAGQYFAEPLVS